MVNGKIDDLRDHGSQPVVQRSNRFIDELAERRRRMGNLFQDKPKMEPVLFASFAQALNNAADDLAQRIAGIRVLLDGFIEHFHFGFGVNGITNHFKIKFQLVTEVIVD